MSTEEKKEFTVKDRRIFSGDQPAGQDREEAPTAKETPPEANREEKKTAGKPQPQKPTGKLPPINFATFILSLNSSALVQLGMIADPISQQQEKNLPLAKQTIDILGMLEEKTKGNLTYEEEGILKHLLYDLRLIYVKEVGK